MGSGRIWCCTAKKLSLAIGWIQTILTGAGLTVMISYFCAFVVVISNSETIDDDYSDSHNNGIIIVSMLIGIIALLIGFVAGTFLIQGVNQESMQKLKIWMIIEVVFCKLSMLSLIMRIFIGGGGAWGWAFRDVGSIILCIICICVVNVHRQHVISSSSHPV